MKRCLACSEHWVSSDDQCPGCGAMPTTIDGFKAFSPSLARAGGGFNPDHFSYLAQLEGKNFWFRARNLLISWALKKYCPQFSTFLEIGCGTGFVLSGVAKAFPSALLQGSEIFTAGLSFAAARQPKIGFMQMDARSIPFVDEFDVIGAFDVLEHIEEDEQVLQQICEALRPKGFMLLTVPQHTWLWSPTDEHACHVRRYSAQEIQERVEKAGFEIIRSTSFVTFLLPAMFISRMLQKKASTKKVDVTAELRISPWLNYLFEKILGAETFMIRRGINFPIGGSRLIVARKV